MLYSHNRQIVFVLIICNLSKSCRGPRLMNSLMPKLASKPYEYWAEGTFDE